MLHTSGMLTCGMCSKISTRMLHPEISGGCDSHVHAHAHTYTHVRTHMPAFVTDKLEEARREIAKLSVADMQQSLQDQALLQQDKGSLQRMVIEMDQQVVL